jgi:hypothetical protein
MLLSTCLSTCTFVIQVDWRGLATSQTIQCPDNNRPETFSIFYETREVQCQSTSFSLILFYPVDKTSQTPGTGNPITLWNSTSNYPFDGPFYSGSYRLTYCKIHTLWKPERFFRKSLHPLRNLILLCELWAKHICLLFPCNRDKEVATAILCNEWNWTVCD